MRAYIAPAGARSSRVPIDKRELRQRDAPSRGAALDVHRDFCEVTIVDAGQVRPAGRVAARPDALELFAQRLGPADWVALEVTGNTWEIARILEPHVARVIVVSPSDTGIRQARAKIDRLDARALAGCCGPAARQRADAR